jgi:hypothetical protein
MLFAYNTGAISTGSGTLFNRRSFFMPLSDASESCFFFPMVMRRRAVVRMGAEVSVVWTMAGMMAAAFLKAKSTRVTMPLMAA